MRCTWVVIGILGGLALAAAPQRNGQADVLFERAVQKETADGDLKGAVEMYRKLAAGAQPRGGGQGADPDGPVLRKAGRRRCAQGLRARGARVRRPEGRGGRGAPASRRQARSRRAADRKTGRCRRAGSRGFARRALSGLLLRARRATRNLPPRGGNRRDPPHPGGESENAPPPAALAGRKSDRLHFEGSDSGRTSRPNCTSSAPTAPDSACSPRRTWEACPACRVCGAGRPTGRAAPDHQFGGPTRAR